MVSEVSVRNSSDEWRQRERGNSKGKGWIYASGNFGEMQWKRQVAKMENIWLSWSVMTQMMLVVRNGAI